MARPGSGLSTGHGARRRTPAVTDANRNAITPPAVADGELAAAARWWLPERAPRPTSRGWLVVRLRHGPGLRSLTGPWFPDSNQRRSHEGIEHDRRRSGFHLITPARVGARDGAAQPDRGSRRARPGLGRRADPAPTAAHLGPEVRGTPRRPLDAPVSADQSYCGKSPAGWEIGPHRAVQPLLAAGDVGDRDDAYDPVYGEEPYTGRLSGPSLDW